MTVDVSVVVPFFNPGADLDDCLASFAEQTLPAERFEVLLIDDGSTDGSAERAERWATSYPGRAAVHRLPASGGPARPRNTGIRAALGRYIQFVDSDDRLAPDALRRLVEVADGSAADVVVGKFASDFRAINHALFRETVTGVTLADFPLMLNLTVCKMFRREFLDHYAIRFPEGPSYIEDQHFCLQAYVHARSVAVVADTVCYFYLRRRTAGHNHGDTAIEPREYCRELADITSLLDGRLTPSRRDVVLTRFVRNEMLGRLRGPGMLRYDADHRRELAGELHRLVTDLVTPGVEAELPAVQRMQLRLLRNDDVNGLLHLADGLERIRLRARTAEPRWQDGRLVLDLDADLVVDRRDGSPGTDLLRLESTGDGGWRLPQWLAPETEASDRQLVRADDEDLDLDLATVAFVDGQLWSTTSGLRLDVVDGVPRIRGEVVIDPGTVRGGRPLDRGRWLLRLRVAFAGLSKSAPLRLAPAGGAASVWLAAGDGGLGSASVYFTGPIPEGERPAVELDIDQSVAPLATHAVVDGCRLDADGVLTIETSALRGPDADLECGVFLMPEDDAAVDARLCPATLRVTPDGAVVRATVADAPAEPDEWSVLLRIGPVGGPAPRRLGAVLRRDAAGNLSAAREIDEI
ncbi:MAG TPA: glycosyltransferase family 2 protein [Mycobacteriales bacterium]|nr:glycosyltransferase family 2 protein [Mycobacteriales bacterium]